MELKYVTVPGKTGRLLNLLSQLSALHYGIPHLTQCTLLCTSQNIMHIYVKYYN